MATLENKGAVVSIQSSPLGSPPGPQEKAHLISGCIFPFLKSGFSHLAALPESDRGHKLITSNTWGNSGPEEGGRGQAGDSYVVYICYERAKCSR